VRQSSAGSYLAIDSDHSPTSFPANADIAGL
jgi:hypothetical protein